MFYDEDIYRADKKGFVEKVELRDYDTALEGYQDGEETTMRFVPFNEVRYKYDTGYGVYDCEVITDDDLKMPETFKCTGNFITPLDIGQSYEAIGEVTTFRGKKQLKVKSIKKIKPSNKRGIISFLQSLKGIGSMAELIYEEFGDESLDVIRNTPLKLLSLSPVLYEELVLDWQKQLLEIKDDQGILLVLMGYGLKSFQAKQLYDQYKESVIEKIKSNPYFLAKEVKGYSFITCDKVAKNVGFDPKSPLRITEGIMFTLSEAQNDGHTFLPKDVLCERAADLLSIKMNYLEMKRAYKEAEGSDVYIYKYGMLSYEVKMSTILDTIVDYENARFKKEKEKAKVIVFKIDPDDVAVHLKQLELEGRIVINDDKVYIKEMYIAEESVAYNIAQIMKSERKIKVPNLENVLDKYLEKNNIQLEDRQREAVLTAAGSLGGFMIINGSAGSGKTFCLNIALKLIKHIYIKAFNFFEVMILAPTGKAARVASKATGRECMTVHRALKYNPVTGYFYNSLNKLPVDCVVLDESSMLDIDIVQHLFEAIPHNAKVIFLGDTKQLPSVGAGNVLKDLIASDKVKVITLDVVKRQSENSGIIKNANRIIAGENIVTQEETKDAYVINITNPDEAINKMFETIEKLKPVYGMNEIQVLCPQKNGTIGVNYLNFLIQERFNPENNEIRFLNREISVSLDGKTTQKFDLFFKKGDKVIHTKNNYSILWYSLYNGKLILNPEGYGVSNGETGRIVKLVEGKDEYDNPIRKIVVKYDDKYIIYEDDFSELDHAYALTIHKSQGSQWKAVILFITSSSYNMLDNNLIYTGYTRARSYIATIGEESAITYAIKTRKSIMRYTGLKERLENVF